MANLTNSNVYVKNSSTGARIDKNCSEKILVIKWYLHDKGYARGWDTEVKRQIYMHNLVLPKKEGYVVDHINENPLDNRAKNLRYLSNSENINRSKGRRSGSYKGVFLIKGRWKAIITKNRKAIALGTFDTAREAAIAYDTGAKLLFGKLSYKNL